MSSRVMMVDADKFVAATNAKVDEYHAKAQLDKDNPYMFIYYEAMGNSIAEMGQIMLNNSKIEQWD